MGKQVDGMGGVGAGDWMVIKRYLLFAQRVKCHVLVDTHWVGRKVVQLVCLTGETQR